MGKNSDTLRRWLTWFAFTLVFAIACGFLSNWQFHRREEKLAVIERVNANYDAAPVPIEELVIAPSAWNEALEWRSATLSGHYLPTKAVLVRNRQKDGSPGFEQLVPFESDSGSVLFVSRGWLPTGNLQDSPDENPLPSAEPATITVRLRASEPRIDRGAPAGQVADIDVPRAAKQLAIDNYFSKIYGRLVSETPAGPALAQLAPPAREEGNNLSYAFQWIAFGVMAFGMLFWAIRQERNRARGIIKPKKKSADEDYEDAATTER